jgi:hypothetical protein
VLLGDGLRLFEDIEPKQIQVETIGVREIGQRTSLKFGLVPE